MTVSIVIPLWNEAGNLPKLLAKLREVIGAIPDLLEVIVVDDGSTDETLTILQQACEEDDRFRVLELTTNFGQVAALSAGMTHARGDVVLTMDGDLQNDPQDILRILQHIREGYDVVGGWRAARHDPLLRRLVSGAINRVNYWLTRVSLRDTGCSLKAYRREIVEAMKDARGVCRFNPLVAFRMAKRVVEIPVRHHARGSGRSKWGWLALVAFNVSLWTASSTALLRMTICAGALSALLGGALFACQVSGLTQDVSPLSAPTMIALLGFLIMLVGIVGDLVARILQELQGRPSFVVKREWTSRSRAAA